MLLLDRGESELALRQLELAEALAAEQRLGLVLEPQLLRGAALTAQGAFEEAIACLRQGLAGPAGATRLRCYGLAMLADALTRQGKHFSTEESTGHRQWKAELHRLEGVALCALNRPEEGQNALEKAMRVARGQQSKAYELRAAMSLARLWYDQSKRHQARALLAPVYSWFIEGLDTRDLKEAGALLGALVA
jgi:tetratricopeptide (TPR) repeat protein